MTQPPKRTELGLLPRLIAAGWFGFAAWVPVIFFFLTFGGVGQRGSEQIDFRVLIFFGEIPVALAALFGFTAGVQILDPIRRTSVKRAVLRGMVVAFLSWLVFIALYIVQTQISKPSPPIGFALPIIMIGSFCMLFPVTLTGALAGWLLCRWSCQPASWEWLLSMPRLSRMSANVWSSIAALSVLFNCALGLYMMRLVRP